MGKQASKKQKQELIKRSYAYLNDNFHKFSQKNKIKVALEIVKKDMTVKQEILADMNLTIKLPNEVEADDL